MKIISDPIPIKWNIQKTCNADDIYGVIGCGAGLEVDYTDIYIKKYEKGYWSSADQEFVHYMANSYWFKCPCCGKENSIEEDEIPVKIRQIIVNSEKENEKKLGRRKRTNKK